MHLWDSRNTRQGNLWVRSQLETSLRCRSSAECCVILTTKEYLVVAVQLGQRPQARATGNKQLWNGFENKTKQTKMKWDEAQRGCRTHLYDNKRVIEVNWGMILCKLLSSNQSSLKWNQTLSSAGTTFIRAWNSSQTKVVVHTLTLCPGLFKGFFSNTVYLDVAHTASAWRERG